LFGWKDERVGTFAPLFANALDGVIASYPARADTRPLRSDIPVGLSTLLPCA
jgi:hypothetical protein